MPLSVYRASVPVFTRALGILSTLLDKGEAHAREKGVDPGTLVQARLAPDMLPLAGQIQRASDTAKLSAQRLSGVAAPRFEDDETTIQALRERIAKTLAYLDGIDPAAMEGSEDRTVELNFGSFKPTYGGVDYLLQFALPNFFFHVTTAYDILRHEGVPVGKRDFIGPPP